MSTDAKIRELERAVVTDPSKLVALQREYVRVGRGWDGQDLPSNDKGYMVASEAPGDYDWRVILAQAPAQLSIAMKFIPAGEFVMGCNTSSYDDEKPEHRRNLPGYWIAKLPTRETDYVIFARATGREIPFAASKETRGAVVNVSWEDSVAFCDWAGLSLQSEEQFEKAARGPAGLTYPWGNEWQPDPDERGPSPYGVEDLCGVVWQWTADAYDADAYKKFVESAVPFDQDRARTGSTGAAAGASPRAAVGLPPATGTRPASATSPSVFAPRSDSARVGAEEDDELGPSMQPEAEPFAALRLAELRSHPPLSTASRARRLR